MRPHPPALSLSRRFTGATDEMTKNYIKTIKDCSKRFEQIPSWTANAEWMEISAELTRKAYPLRGAMNALATASPAKAAARKFYGDLEVMMTEARNKNGAKVNAAYEASVSDLKAYLATL